MNPKGLKERKLQEGLKKIKSFADIVGPETQIILPREAPLEMAAE